MDNRFVQDQSEAQRLTHYAQPLDQLHPPWTPSLPYSDHPQGHPVQSSGGVAFAAAHFPFFGCSQSAAPFPSLASGGPENRHFSARHSHYSTAREQQLDDSHGTEYHLEAEPHSWQHRQDKLYHGSVLPWPSHGTIPGAAQSEEEADLQRSMDTQWLGKFSQLTKNRSRNSPTSQQASGQSVAGLGNAVHGIVQLLCQLEEFGHTLKHNLQKDGVWEDSYRAALHVQRELQDRAQCLERLKAVTGRAARRRARRLRAREERAQAEQRSLEREATINTWRMKRIQQVEEKKKEKELKLAADSVLSEVKKKQADVKRMQDVLRSLEKLRRLRKDAAHRRGIVTDQQCDIEFGGRQEQLRSVLKKRTMVYSAEEKALMVMLEGEQEKERRQEQETRGKKERERQLQRKHAVESILFGEEPPADHLMEPFTQYYTQAQQSLHSLMQVRREWDIFIVAADHQDGSSIPHSWILSDHPSDNAWASARA